MKWSRFVVTLIAKPCIETQRRTLTPRAAILAGEGIEGSGDPGIEGRTQTPVAAGSRSPWMWKWARVSMMACSRRRM